MLVHRIDDWLNTKRIDIHFNNVWFFSFSLSFFWILLLWYMRPQNLLRHFRNKIRWMAFIYKIRNWNLKHSRWVCASHGMRRREIACTEYNNLFVYSTQSPLSSNCAQMISVGKKAKNDNDANERTNSNQKPPVQFELLLFANAVCRSQRIR